MSAEPSSPSQSNANQFLSQEHARSDEVAHEWDQDNQQWWDWYMSLAENAADKASEPLIELPAQKTWPFPSDAQLSEHLNTPFDISEEHIAAFQRDGFIKLKNLIEPAALGLLRQEMAAMFTAVGEKMGSRFSSLEMMWETNAVIKQFVFSRRLAQLAASLLGVVKVRLYHDNGLAKQPGCGRTPWHYDAHHFPIATDDVCTVWIPLQEIPESMGPLGFAKGMDLVEKVASIPFNKFDTSYDQKIMACFRENNISVEASAFDLGEASFHHNFCFHTAGPNRTTTPRMVLATTYFADGARVIDAPHMVNGDWRRFMPGIEPGQIIDTDKNPVLN
jgi:ectoine hydroxylase-related dioxygenase (phytanoyl-CoA dioxygenase family)